ncbi:MAG TPA: hypothetical protein VFM94_08730, partial [Solirubrobacterales bacterium]|nr:hypothetical protein [Solirubrobacterales bacterium]
LVLRDTNGKEDVYQWEEMGAGSCNEESRDFSPAASGCVSLITSGGSPFDSEFVDASPSGRDVFVRTGQSLVASDPGQFDIYDVRVGGGFASQNQPPPAPPCEGESCQSPPPSPRHPTPASAAFEGGGNLAPRARCAKGRKRVVQNGKARCLRSKRQRRAKRRHGRAGR